MGRRANADAVERAVNGPDFDAALALINGRIQDAKDAQSQASGRASQAWGDLEKLGVNKRGAQMFARVLAIDDDAEQQDQLRTFFELCKREGIGLHVDLVDQAQGKTEHVAPVVAKTTPAPTPMATDEETKALADGAPPTTTEKLAENPKPKRQGKPSLAVVSGTAAKDAAKAHLGGGAPDALA
jgi:hypothetical protein